MKGRRQVNETDVATAVIRDLLSELIYLFYYPSIKLSGLTKLFEHGDFRDLASVIMNSTSG